MKKFILSVALCLCGIFTANAQQDLKKSVCVVKQNYTDAEKEAYEKTASTLFSNSYMSAARQLRKFTGSFGSGFLYKAENGKLYIITNKHVVKDAKAVQLVFKTDGTEKTIPNCNVVAKSDTTDIAIVEFPGSIGELSPLVFSADPVTDGTSVWSAGFPGLGDEPAWQLGNGIVSNGKYNNKTLTDGANIDVIQHTAQVDPGSSGGPLLILKENNKTIQKEVTVGRKKKTVSETIIEKEYQVVGMNTWKAFHRENANFSLMAKDIKNMVNSINVVTSSNSKNADQLQVQIEKFMELFNESGEKMTAFISDDMVTTMPEDQMVVMLGNISDNANTTLRNGDAIEGLKLMVADNIIKSIKKPKELKVNNVSVDGNTGTATFSYGKKQYSSSWEKNYDGWKLTSTDIIKAKKKDEIEEGFRVLDLSGNRYVEFNIMSPRSDYYHKDEDGDIIKVTDKVKYGINYERFFAKYISWGATFDLGKAECYTLDSISRWNSDTRDYDNVAEEKFRERTYGTFFVGMGAQCPMAVNRIYFALDVKAQLGISYAFKMDDEDYDSFDASLNTSLCASLNVGYMFKEDRILYLGFGTNRKKCNEGLFYQNFNKLKYYVVKVGFMF